MAMDTTERQAADDLSDSDGVAERTAAAPTGSNDASVSPDGLGGGSAEPEPNGVVFESLTERAVVRLEVDGEIATGQFPAEGDGTRDDGVAVARLDGRGSLASFRFSGPVVAVEILRGDVTASLDLRTAAPDEPGSERRIGVHAQGSDVDYSFTVSGVVEPGADATFDGADERGERTVTGRVAGSGVDEYTYAGEITEFEASSDDVLVLLDDRVVDPDDLG